MKYQVALLAVLILIILILGNLKAIAFDRTYMLEEFGKYRIYDKIPNADNILDKIYDYFNQKSLTLQVKEFNQRELDHMRDVKRLFVFGEYIFYISLALFFILLLLVLNKADDIRRTISGILLTGSYASFVTIMLMADGSFSNFFSAFHKLFFPSGSYIFNPSVEILTVMFPFGIFYDIAVLLFIYLMAEIVVFFILGLIMARSLKTVWFFRPGHAIFGMLAVLLGQIASGGSIQISAMLSIGLFIIANFMLNDYMDIEIDRINKPNRVLPSAEWKKNSALALSALHLVLGLIFASLVNTQFLIWLCIAAAASISYSFIRKNILSNILTAALFASSFVFGGISVGVPSALTYYFMALGSLFVFGREIIKDILDIDGDRRFRYRTIPILYGIRKSRFIVRSAGLAGIIISSILLPITSPRFFIIMVLANTCLSIAGFIKPQKAKHMIYIGMIIALLAGYSLWI